MVFNLNIVDLTIAITSWNKLHFIYKKLLSQKTIYNSITYKIHPTRTTKLGKILSRIKLRLQYE
jgi:hypothetical protein